LIAAAANKIVTGVCGFCRLCEVVRILQFTSVSPSIFKFSEKPAEKRSPINQPVALSPIDVVVYTLLSQDPFLVQTVIQKMAPNKPSMATIRSSRSPKSKSEVLKTEREEQKECTLSGEPFLKFSLYNNVTRCLSFHERRYEIPQWSVV
jgi:hypothetical protein